MFDPEEMVPFSKIGLSILEAPAHKAHALKMARQSMVLLKNEQQILPLNKSLKIAVVGPNADDESVMLANYYGYTKEVTSLLEGIRKKTNSEVIYLKGINITNNNVFKSEYKSGYFTSNGREGFEAEYFNNTNFTGAPVLVRAEQSIDNKWGDGEEIAVGIISRDMSVRWTTTPCLSLKERAT